MNEWVAMDSDGDVHTYLNKPELSNELWGQRFWKATSPSNFLYTVKDPTGYEDSLKEITL